MRAALFTASFLTAIAAVTSVAAAPFQVEIDHSARINLPGAASTVLVGNPAVADVTVVDSRTVFVSGRGYGVTNIVVLDRNGRTLFDNNVVVSSPTANIAMHRGSTRSEYACAQACQVAVRLTGGGGASGPQGAPGQGPVGDGIDAIGSATANGASRVLGGVAGAIGGAGGSGPSGVVRGPAGVTGTP